MRVPMIARGVPMGAGPQSHDCCDLYVRPALTTAACKRLYRLFCLSVCQSVGALFLLLSFRMFFSKKAIDFAISCHVSGFFPGRNHVKSIFRGISYIT